MFLCFCTSLGYSSLANIPFCSFLFDSNNSCLSLLFINLTKIGLVQWTEYFPTLLQLAIGIFVALLNTSCESLWFPGIVHDITSVPFCLCGWSFSHGPSETPVSSTLFSNAFLSSDNILDFRLRFSVFSFDSVLSVGPFGLLHSLIYLASLGN